MSTKRKFGCFLLVAVAAAALYAAFADLNFEVGWHVQGGINSRMEVLFDFISAYRKENGKWPATLDCDDWRGWATFSDPWHRAPDGPILYNPDARPGTNDILMAQPVPVSMGHWPIRGTCQTGINR